MATVTLKGNPVTVAGKLPRKGEGVSDFSLTGKDLGDVSLKNYTGKRKVLNIVPSLDTPTCQQSTRVFNQKASSVDNSIVLVTTLFRPSALQKRDMANGRSAEMTSTIELSTLDAFWLNTRWDCWQGGRFRLGTMF